MQLQNIDKARYRKHLNQVIVVFIISFALCAVAFGQILIWLLSDAGENNFWLNVIGVALALGLVMSTLNHYKNKPYLAEILYVWQLKQQINYIYRKLNKIKKAGLEQNELDALIILDFYYKACRQLYTLDDNTITLSSLDKEQSILDNVVAKHHLCIDHKQYQQTLLAKF